MKIHLLAVLLLLVSISSGELIIHDSFNGPPGRINEVALGQGILGWRHVPDSYAPVPWVDLGRLCPGPDVSQVGHAAIANVTPIFGPGSQLGAVHFSYIVTHPTTPGPHSHSLSFIWQAPPGEDPEYGVSLGVENRNGSADQLTVAARGTGSNFGTFASTITAPKSFSPSRYLLRGRILLGSTNPISISLHSLDDPAAITSNMPEGYVYDANISDYFPGSILSGARPIVEMHVSLSDGVTIDELKVGTTWADVSYRGGAPAEDAPLSGIHALQDGRLLISFDGVIQSSPDLIHWLPLDPQPRSPLAIAPGSAPMFYRAAR